MLFRWKNYWDTIENYSILKNRHKFQLLDGDSGNKLNNFWVLRTWNYIHFENMLPLRNFCHLFMGTEIPQWSWLTVKSLQLVTSQVLIFNRVVNNLSYTRNCNVGLTEWCFPLKQWSNAPKNVGYQLFRGLANPYLLVRGGAYLTLLLLYPVERNSMSRRVSFSFWY